MDLPKELIVTITLGNDAMQTPEDAAKALRGVCDRLDRRETGGAIFDVNGNYVGQFKID